MEGRMGEGYRENCEGPPKLPGSKKYRFVHYIGETLNTKSPAQLKPEAARATEFPSSLRQLQLNAATAPAAWPSAHPPPLGRKLRRWAHDFCGRINKIPEEARDTGL